MFLCNHSVHTAHFSLLIVIYKSFMNHFYSKLEKNKLTLSGNNVLIFEELLEGMDELLRHWISEVNSL